MIIVLKREATKKEINYLIEKLKSVGLKPHLSHGVERTIICVIGDERVVSNFPFKAIPAIENVLPILTPYKLAGREFKKEKTVSK